MTSFNDIPVPGSKLFSHNGCLYGSTGSAEDKVAFQRWLEQGGDPPDLDDVNFLIVAPDGLTMMTERLIPIPIDMPKWALGCGGPLALGAMYAGASAVRAVEIACQLDVHCGFGVETLRLPRRRKEG
jgi:hypothetical protein